MSYTIGEVVTITGTLTEPDGTLVDPTTVVLAVVDPNGNEQTYTDLARTGVGTYTRDILLDIVGDWRWRLTTTGFTDATEGVIECVSMFDGQVTDIRDLRVLIPACRRAIDGPQATSPDSPATTLRDGEVLGLVADATGMLILQTQGEAAFGCQLVVAGRDPYYKAPNAWATDVPRPPAVDAAILSQAALDFYYFSMRQFKVSETVKNEAVEWTYTHSASVIAGWMQYLRDNRDRAIAALQVIDAPLDRMVSLVAERDFYAAAFLEPYTSEVGAPVPYWGGPGVMSLGYDFRFSTFG